MDIDIEVIMKLAILAVSIEFIEFVLPTHTSGFLKREAAQVMCVQKFRRNRKKAHELNVSYPASVLQAKMYVSSFEIKPMLH